MFCWKVRTSGFSENWKEVCLVILECSYTRQWVWSKGNVPLKLPIKIRFLSTCYTYRWHFWSCRPGKGTSLNVKSCLCLERVQSQLNVDSAGSILHISPYTHNSVHILAGIFWPRNQRLISRRPVKTFRPRRPLLASSEVRL